MNDIITISGIRGFIDEHGVAQLNAEDVARGWGFTQTAKSGNVVVRWERVNKYLDEFGFIPTSGDGVGANDFIPENMVYRLGFKANNEAAQVFQAKLADEVLPAIRKTGSFTTKPMTIEDMIIAQAQSVKELKAAHEQTRKEIACIRDTVVVRPDQKRQWINSTINKIVSAMGGDRELYGKIKTETYLLLNARLGVNIYTRRNNRRAKTGQSISALEIVLADKKLTEGYIAILKEYAIKYGVAA